MSKEEISPERRIRELREEIQRHNTLYYDAAKSEISDFDFDMLLKELESLENQYPLFRSSDSPTQKVGGTPIASFQSVTHRLPMLSIDNAYQESEIREFDQRVRKLLDTPTVDYAVEFKIDGVALALVYENGQLVQAVTRGDGTRGDDVTHNALVIHGLPHQLDTDSPPERIEIRGEVYISNSDFSHLRAEQERNGEELFANSRNTAAGGLKLLDPRLSRQRRLQFFAHGLGDHSEIGVHSHLSYLNWLSKCGIPATPNVEVCSGIDATFAHCQQMMERLHELNFEVDGLVIKVNDFEQRLQLGNTSKSPRWLIAYKWEKYEALTRVLAIETGVGKTGTVTPVAILEPVLIAGSTISRTSLHNNDELNRLGLKIGDWITVEKAGKVIPHVVRVEEHLRTGEEIDYVFPTECPECAQPLVQDEGGVYIRCQNPSCPAQLRESLRFFVSRQGMEIDGLGIKIIEQLISAGLLHSFADLYRLHEKREKLRSLERMGDKTIDNILTSVAQSKQQPLWRLLTAMNIRHVGASNARVLAARFGTMQAISSQTAESLEMVDEIGPTIAKSVADYFASEAGQQTVRELEQLGLNFGDASTVTSATDNENLPFFGKTIVVTGTLPTLKRDEIQELIRQNGGKASASVSKKTSFVVYGEDAGSKLDKARELGLETVNENEFLGMLKRAT